MAEEAEEQRKLEEQQANKLEISVDSQEPDEPSPEEEIKTPDPLSIERNVLAK